MAATSQASGSWFMPLGYDWKGYTKKELAFRTAHRLIDAGITPMYSLVYLVMAAIVAADHTLPQHSEVPPLLPLRFALIALTSYVVVCSIMCLPAPLEKTDDFLRLSCYGRWVFLTRHGLVIQMWHMIFSLLGVYLPWLGAVTHGISIGVATLAWFVTIQFFILVMPDKEYLDSCKTWEKAGVQIETINNFIHIPALFVAIIDLLFLKDGVALQGCLSLGRSTCFMFGFATCYQLLIMRNYKFTGHWPYEFMKSFGANVQKWVAFVATQFVTSSIFLIMNYAIVYLKLPSR